jgi:hypothetical protein
MANLKQIEHIVVLMLENRSFDNVFGWLYDPANPAGVLRAEGKMLHPQPARKPGPRARPSAGSGGSLHCEGEGCEARAGRASGKEWEG